MPSNAAQKIADHNARVHAANAQPDDPAFGLCPRSLCGGELRPSNMGDCLICRRCAVHFALDLNRALPERTTADAKRYRALREIALGDDCDAWTRFYFAVDYAMVERPGPEALFDAYLDAALGTLRGEG